MFLVIFLTILLLSALFWWWTDRRLRLLPRARYWRIGLALFIAPQLAYALALVLVPGFRQISHHWVPPSALAIMYIWHLLVLPAWALVMGAIAAVRLALAAIQWMIRRAAQAPAETAPFPGPSAATAPAWSRRQLLIASAAAAPPISAIGLAGIGIARLNDYRTRYLDVPIAGLPTALDGLSIAHVTDIHVGRYTRGPQLARIAETTNRLKADLVLMTGDLLDGSLLDLPEAIDFMRRLDPRLGLAMCEGNHDLFGGAAAFRSRVKAAGIPLLVQETMSLDIRGEPVQLLGARWSRGEETIRGAMQELLTRRDPDAFAILLAHHPHCFDYAAAAGVPLTLAGHTHGGQLMLNQRLGAGPAMFRYWTGMYEQAAAKLIVCNGAGNWFPLRTAAPAEIIHLTLRRAS